MSSIGLSKSPWDWTRERLFPRLARSGCPRPSGGLPGQGSGTSGSGEIDEWLCLALAARQAGPSLQIENLSPLTTCRAPGGDREDGLAVRPNPIELDTSGTVPGQKLTSSHGTKLTAFPGRICENCGFRRFDDTDCFRPHDPLVVCSNHTGPSLIWWRDFLCGSRFGGCGVGTPGSDTVSKTVSKRPRERPAEVVG